MTTYTDISIAQFRIAISHAQEEIDDDHAVYFCRMLAEGRLSPDAVMELEPREWEGAVTP